MTAAPLPQTQPVADLEQLEISSADTEPTRELGERRAAAVAGTRAVLRGRIESSRDDVARASVKVQREPSGIVDAARERVSSKYGSSREADGAQPLDFNVNDDGSFEFDVTEAAQNTSHVAATARHPALKTVTALVSTQPLQRARPGEQIVLTVVLQMFDEICRVRGRVATGNDEALSSTITAFELTHSGLEPVFAKGLETKEGGEFELELAPRPHVLLAYARDWRPATAQVACACGETLELSPLMLDRGLTISGQALLGSTPFAAGMTVTARLEQPLTLVKSGVFTFAWTGERFEWLYRQARANELGLYELTALGNRSYSVKLFGLGDPGTPLLDSQSVSVLAPKFDVELAPPLCELRLTFFENGKPSPTRFVFRQHLSQTTVRFSDYSADSGGKATLWLMQGHAAEIVVTTATPEERVYNIVTCDSNGVTEMRIDL